eukprot:Gregarina_sp_Pseudo_9__1724@NODE_216_length_3573_cov_22_949349_g201_i0_p1_GENE_NODE_216_length_3573_cov_22_949349_g201_i0NODE_216_length_3573_cov_22_949349_g201_i0_p1_ORF_typecomplete_len623_score183_80zfRanBP/PF00641_18/1_7e08_NODE_216_length_3573_cov_22_949349_g201_i07662634
MKSEVNAQQQTKVDSGGAAAFPPNASQLPIRGGEAAEESLLRSPAVSPMNNAPSPMGGAPSPMGGAPSPMSGTPAVLMSPAPYGPGMQISGMLSPASSGGRYPMMGFDPSQLMILQQVEGGKMTASPIDPLKLGLVPSTPLMTMSPMAAPALVAPPGTPVYGAAGDGMAPPDWSQHYLQIANLQNLTTGFLSPAGPPLSPTAMVNGAPWHALTATTATPGLVATPLSLRAAAAPADKQVDERNSDSRATRDASEKASEQHPAEEPTHAWLNYGAFPAYATHIISPAAIVQGQSDTATAGTASSAKLVEDHPALFAQSADFAAGSLAPGGAKPDGRLVDTVLHAKSLTEQMLREFSVEGAADVLRTALSLLGRPSGDGTDTQTTVGDLADLPAAAAALPSVKLVHPDEFKNASTFLKIYGDPLCFTKNGPLPKKGRNGNWECSKCNNVNFPRRFRCNMCSTTRDEEGDRVVSEYARQVYERYIFIYRNQQGQNGGAHQIILDRDPLDQQQQQPVAASNAQSASLLPPASGHNASGSRQSGGSSNFHHHQQQSQQPQQASFTRQRGYNNAGGVSRTRYNRPPQFEGNTAAFPGPHYATQYPNHQQQAALLNQYPGGRQDYSVYY